MLGIATLITVASVSAIRFVRADRYAPANAPPPTPVALPGSTAPLAIVDPATLPTVLVEPPDDGDGAMTFTSKPNDARPRADRHHRVRRSAPATSQTPPNPYP